MNSSIPSHGHRALWRLLFLLCPLLLVACSDGDTVTVPVDTNAQTLRVAVICAPEEMDKWQRTAEWAASNLQDAQQGASSPIRLEFTFKNQNDDDLVAYVKALANDSTVDAIVGPTTTKAATSSATEFVKETSTKPFISPNATGIEYQRIFSTNRNVWNMSECDIAQIESFMANISSTDNTREVALVVEAGKKNGEEPEFAQWFGFLATEYGLTVDGIYTYQNASDISAIAKAMLSGDQQSGEAAVLFVPSSYEVAKRLDVVADSVRATMPADVQLFYPDIYCTDAFVSDSIRQNVTTPIYLGFDLSPDPYSGFSLMYKSHFKEEPQNGEAQLYDALSLLALAAKRQAQTGSGTLNDALEELTSSQSNILGNWTVSGLQTSFDAIGAGTVPVIDGASGRLTFDVANRSGRCGTFYRLWRLYNHEYVTLGYFSDEDNSRTFTTSGAMWNQTATVLDSLDITDTHYPAYSDRAANWAFLIAASPGWGNYRFEADVFTMYQILKRNGYDDDHIVLVCEDDIAYNSRNLEQGVLRTTPTGENVYNQAAIDYHLSDLTPSDLADILAGRKSERLPKVIGATKDDNVFVFWSGHGNDANPVTGRESYCEYGETGSIPHSELRDMLAAVTHRKMMVAIESCYSGALGERCVGIPGLVVISAANATESSVPDIWDEPLLAYRSNSFTQGFLKALDANPNITLRNLYYTLARSTFGSHVKVYNAAYYGNVYTETMGEYLSLK